MLLVVIFAMAAQFRLASLDASGFAEDEIDILRAVESYRNFDFSANAEHPMLGKLAALASMRVTDGWNDLAPRLHLLVVSPETALRLPVALAGALTTLAIFLLVERLFDTEVGVWAALLWAFDVNATGINRLAKEDTWLVFFFLLASWLFERSKQESGSYDKGRQHWGTASGAAFGLMTASKYMPHFLGLHGVFNTISALGPGEQFPRNRRFFLALGAAFLSANFGLLLPATWRRLFGYLQGQKVIHTGYAFAHQVYVNRIDVTPWGVPSTFYLVFLATKIPVLVLAAFFVGVIQMVRHRQARGFVFTRVFLVFFVLGYSLLAAKFIRYVLPLLAFVDILAAVGIVWMLRRLAGSVTAGRWRLLAITTGGLCCAIPPLYAQISTHPFPGLYQNAIGAHIAPTGYLFPEAFNDAGVREAVGLIAAHARPGAVIVSDATTVVAEYLARAGRSDMHAWSISHDGLPMGSVETWVLVQDEHRYFENEAVIDQLQRRLRPWREVRVLGAVSVRVFQISATSSELMTDQRQRNEERRAPHTKEADQSVHARTGS